MNETRIQRRIMVALSRIGVRIFRNNVGTAKQGERTIKFGLCKGSSDLIGWTKVNGVAVFTAVEVKRPMKKPTEPQRNFIHRVREDGGIAGVATSEDEAVELIESEVERVKQRYETPKK
jgi:VRR-NUC domain.